MCPITMKQTLQDLLEFIVIFAIVVKLGYSEKLQALQNIVKFASFCVNFCGYKTMESWKDC